MARYTGPRIRVSRRFGTPIFGPSKYLERKPYGPGVHGPKSARRKTTDYGLALLEKQKMRAYYGLMERQFRGVYEAAVRRPGRTGELMLVILETRLDSIVYSLGLGYTRFAARQMIVHGHVQVNGKRARTPSYACRANDVVEIQNNNKSRLLASRNLEISTSRVVPGWLLLNKEGQKGTIMRLPAREDLQPISNEQTIVEFYSR
ncbi:MAG: 30S ribosomal protein S4 [Pedosphaera sp.]|nr:30S ribosomal protein S4 [Pedosphaera sp.]MSU42782.1 30S ribosomal protein S4 [Pedosphaera sp.]